MHPERTLMFLTVFAGAGQGIFWVSFLISLFIPEIAKDSFVFQSIVLAFVFQLIGIASSFFHLGNPQRAIRALLMFRTSWLSREIITFSGFTGVLFLYLLSIYFNLPRDQSLILGLICVILSIGYFISSSMLYMSIRFVREWANGFTFANFTLIGLLGGLGWTLMIFQISSLNSKWVFYLLEISIWVGIIGLIVKLLTFRYNKINYDSIGARNALGLNESKIKLMDTGSAYANYNIKEYSHSVDSAGKKKLQISVIFLLYIIPILIWVIAFLIKSPQAISILLFVSACFVLFSSLLERKLFFIEGNHWQNLYYGNYKKEGLKNPILSKARANTPVPVLKN